MRPSLSFPLCALLALAGGPVRAGQPLLAGETCTVTLIPVTGQTTACPGETVELEATITNISATAMTFNWDIIQNSGDPDITFSPDHSSITLEPGGGVQDPFTILATISEDSLLGLASMEIKVNGGGACNEPLNLTIVECDAGCTATLITATGQTTACPGETVELEATITNTGATAEIFEWVIFQNSGATSITFSPDHGSLTLEPGEGARSPFTILAIIPEEAEPGSVSMQLEVSGGAACEASLSLSIVEKLQGACCFWMDENMTELACMNLTEEECDSLRGPDPDGTGSYQGDGTDCGDPDVLSPCCLGDGGCQPTIQVICDCLGGTWFDLFTSCQHPFFGPQFDQSPQDATTCVGGSASFSVVVSNLFGEETYEWTVTPSGGTSQEVGENSPDLTLTDVPLAWDGAEVQVTVTDDCVDRRSESAILTVNTLSCSLGSQDFEANETKPVVLTIGPNDCGDTISGTWTIVDPSDPDLYAASPASGAFSIDERDTFSFTTQITNLGRHGAPVELQLVVEPVTCETSGTMTFTKPKITSIGSQYTDVFKEGGGGDRSACYLRAVSVEETFTVDIDWRGHPFDPGVVEFITPFGTTTVQTNGLSASMDYDMGSDWSVNDTLRVKAISSDGSESDECEANFQVFDPPLPGTNDLFSHVGSLSNALKYKASSLSVNPWAFEKSASAHPPEVPGQGNQQWDWKPKFSPEFEVNGSDCTAEVKLTSALGEMSLGVVEKVAPTHYGKRLESETAHGLSASLKGKWVYDGSAWSWQSGTIGVEVSGSVACPPNPATFPLFPVLPIPAYAQGTYGLSLGAELTIDEWTDLNPLLNSATVTLAPKASFLFGLGVPSIIGLQALLGGTQEVQVSYPNPTLTGFKTIASGRVQVVLLLFTIDLVNASCNWDLLNISQSECVFGAGPLPVSWQVMPRDYRGPGFASFQGGYLRPEGPVPPTFETTIVTDEFPQATPEIARTGNDLMMVWLTDDGRRGDMDRTLAVSSRFDGSHWSSPAAIADDGTADFFPRVAGLPDGDALAAWMNVRGLMPFTNDPIRMLERTEIAVARFDDAAQSWGRQVLLTDDDRFDRDPRLAVATDGSALLIWVANAGSELFGSFAEPNELLYARFDGSAWGPTQVAATGVPSVLNLGGAYDGTRAVVLYTGDLDTNLVTPLDHELFALQFDGSSWTGPSQLTSDELIDTNPQVLYDGAGDLLFGWSRDGDLVTARELDLSDLVIAVDSEGPSGGLLDFRLAAGDDGRVALAWPEASAELADLNYAFLASGETLWSFPRQLLADVQVERDISAVVGPSGNLSVAYPKDLIVFEPQTVVFGGELFEIEVPTVVQTDLQVVHRLFVPDLAVEDEDIRFEPPIPLAGQNTLIRATIQNLGDFPTGDVEVGFYDGDPQAGGVLIGELQVISETLAAGATAEVQVSWTAPDDGRAHEVYVVVDPDQTLPDVDPDNNTARAAAFLPNLVLEELWVEEFPACEVRIRLRVVNLSTLAAGPFEIFLRQGTPDGLLLTVFGVAGLAPGEEVSEAFDWIPEPGPDGTVRVFVIVDEVDAVAEATELDNTDSVLIDLTASRGFDCNGNGIRDDCDIASGTSLDVNANGIPDECE